MRFDSSKKSKVKLADSRSLQVEGTGNMEIKRSDGSSAIIEDVLFVPTTKYGLQYVKWWSTHRKGFFSNHQK
jgi:hypothetical protein